MSDTAPPPAFMDADEIAPRTRRGNPEHVFQAWADRLLDRIVEPPMFVTGIDHAATDMAHIGRRSALQGRGVKFGIPDMFVCQAPSAALWIELKRGSHLSSVQIGVHGAMRAAGQFVATCGTMSFIVQALRRAGFKLHPNADELAREYEMRVEAKEKAPATPRKTWKPRVAKPSVRDVTRFERARGRTL